MGEKGIEGGDGGEIFGFAEGQLEVEGRLGGRLGRRRGKGGGLGREGGEVRLGSGGDHRFLGYLFLCKQDSLLLFVIYDMFIKCHNMFIVSVTRGFINTLFDLFDNAFLRGCTDNNRSLQHFGRTVFSEYSLL